MKIEIDNLSFHDSACYACDSDEGVAFASGHHFETEFEYKKGYRRIYVPLAPVCFNVINEINRVIEIAKNDGRELGKLIFKDQKIGFVAF